MFIFYECPIGAIQYLHGQDEGGEVQKISVFVHAHGIKLSTQGRGVKKWQNSVNVVVECPLMALEFMMLCYFFKDKYDDRREKSNLLTYVIQKSFRPAQSTSGVGWTWSERIKTKF